MNLPRGDLVRSRVVADPADALELALDRTLSGYVVFEPQGTLLLDGETRGVITFDAGVPVLAYNTTTDRGGPDALADLAVPGPYRADLYELPERALAEAHDTPELRVPPGMPAEELADAADLAARTRAVAPDDRADDEDGHASAVEAFLADEAKIDAIRERAREEAQTRAEEWGFADELREPSRGRGEGDGAAW
ncbi:hypothetical protein [Halegenticoccus tardaugens]|uniref:hypothetical protein n=1 Tax=Halegenticoccus tardaugens TaxID=2071624 RepID=UPI00100B7E34|nr:hypothetical protein [Halegenticoccus tardaugens]